MDGSGSNTSWPSSTLGSTATAFYTAPEVIRTFQLLCYGVIGESIALFGIATNILNIVCFVKQGFKESINISLLSLAVADMGCLITILLINVTLIPAFQEAEIPFDATSTSYLTVGIPHVMFTRVSGVITAFITLERCLCITMPLKVKSIFTTRNVATINAGIFTTLIVSFSPIYFGSKLDMAYFPERNRTLLGLVSLKHRTIIDQVSFSINSVLIPGSALLIIIVGMVTMVIALEKQRKWRNFHTGFTKADSSSSEREVRLVKMIVMISTLFVACFCPSVILLLLVTIRPDFNVGGQNVHVAILAYGFSTIAESTNSSMNILIYYKMSRKYRLYFREIFKYGKQGYIY